MRRISYWILSTVSAVVLLFGFDASQSGHPATTPLAAFSGATAGTTSGSASGSSGSTGSSGSSGSSGTTSGSGSSNGSSSGNGSSSSSGSSGSSGSSPGSSSGSSGSSSGSATPTTPATPTTRTVTGSAVQTAWGPVQVELRISGTKITKVGILQYPNGNSRDVQIAQYSIPVLIQETLKSQSAHIDMVSGATYTSTGYIQSLQSAIDQANL